MKTCQVCLGWGVVLTYNEVPPSTAEARMAARRLHVSDGLKIRTLEIACPRCAGWGTVPDSADNDRPIRSGAR